MKTMIPSIAVMLLMAIFLSGCASMTVRSGE